MHLENRAGRCLRKTKQEPDPNTDYSQKRVYTWMMGAAHVCTIPKYGFAPSQLQTGLLRAVLLCTLALLVGVSAPGASMAWLYGGHATLGQVALHKEELALGVARHHPRAEQRPAAGNVCARERPSGIATHDGSYLSSGMLGWSTPSDLIKAVTVHTLDLSRSDLSRRLMSYLSASFRQVYRSPPHRPPIFS